MFWIESCLVPLSPPAQQKATLFHTTLNFSPDASVGNRFKILHSKSQLFWVAEQYIIYLTNLNRRSGKRERICLCITIGCNSVRTFVPPNRNIKTTVVPLIQQYFTALFPSYFEEPHKDQKLCLRNQRHIFTTLCMLWFETSLHFFQNIQNKKIVILLPPTSLISFIRNEYKSCPSTLVSTYDIFLS